MKTKWKDLIETSAGIPSTWLTEMNTQPRRKKNYEWKWHSNGYESSLVRGAFPEQPHSAYHVCIFLLEIYTPLPSSGMSHAMVVLKMAHVCCSPQVAAKQRDSKVQSLSESKNFSFALPSLFVCVMSIEDLCRYLGYVPNDPSVWHFYSIFFMVLHLQCTQICVISHCIIILCMFITQERGMYTTQ